MVVLKAYMDASGSAEDPATPFLSVAAVAAFEGGWKIFEKQWNRALADEGVDHMHMKDFAHFKGPFKAWRGDEERRKRFLQRLLKIGAGNCLVTFASVMRVSDHAEVNKAYMVTEHHGGPYSVGCGMCVAKLRRHTMPRGIAPEYTEILVEHGDCDQDDFVAMMQRDVFGQVPIIKPKHSVVGGKDVYIRPFELADLVAYEFRKAIEARAGNRRIRRSGIAVQDILNVHGGHLTTEAMMKNCAADRVPTRGGPRR